LAEWASLTLPFCTTGQSACEGIAGVPPLPPIDTTDANTAKRDVGHHPRSRPFGVLARCYDFCLKLRTIFDRRSQLSRHIVKTQEKTPAMIHSFRNFIKP
jgi:hypothetical protein